MAPQIPWRDRPQLLRRATFDITLRDGIAALTHPRVAAEMGISLSSIRRWVRADRLPRCALEWNVRHRRIRLRDAVRGQDWPVHRRAAELLRGDLPLDDERRDEERAWILLTTAYERTGWARDEFDHRHRWTTSVIDALLSGLPDHEARRGRVRLWVLVQGVRVGVANGDVTPSEAGALLETDLAAIEQLRGDLGRGAA
jgi:hypothetical protein